MIEIFEEVKDWIKKQPIRGCLAGSSLLGYWEDADIDVFVYDAKSFTKLLYILHYTPDFQITNKLDKWKYDKFMNDQYDTFFRTGLATIKFTYNTCVTLNIILKKGKDNIFSVLSSFDMDIVAKGYDIKTKQILDLTNKSGISNIASWNTWNTDFYNPSIWQASRILRQLGRVFKYHKRGFNTDNTVLKYLDMIKEIQEYQSIFNSNDFNVKLKQIKTNTKIIKEICEVWLDTHEILDETLELLNTKLKEI